jgi:NAD(P)-dependent dehydrogenase (short-subunit alcohol dehydrogenase family)
MQDQQLRGKVCFVTGGSSGIGRAIALEFARNGARVAIAARDQSAMAEVVEQARSEQAQMMCTVADVTDFDALTQAVDLVVERWGTIDIVVANAGTNGTWAPIGELQVDEWRKTLDVNLTGTFLTIKAAVDCLRRKGGSVIVVSSVNGTRMFSNGGASAYASSKAGQVALTKMLALELAKDKVRVNAICPGTIASAIHGKTKRRDIAEAAEPVEFPEGKIPLTDGQAGTAEQVAATALFLASEQSNHVTGSIVFVDGGQSLLQG